MCGLMVALTIIVTTMCVDAYPTYNTWDMKELTEEDMNKHTRCHADVSKSNKTGCGTVFCKPHSIKISVLVS